MQWALFLFLFGFIANLAESARWALLAATSKGWINYRHQADVCHAYQILKNRGFPEDHIIVFMYDDIANNKINPYPGKIFNEVNGPDLYEGVKIDYKGQDITPENFLNVLKGNKTAMNGIGTGRVIESTQEDTVFVNLVDHGSPGFLAFPESNLYADQLEETLHGMSQNKQFSEMLFYVEACDAGSMFDNVIKENDNILVSTASARFEVSFAANCMHPKINTCLADAFSSTWMKSLENLGFQSNGKSIFHEYDFVRTKVTKSHVQLYGDFRVGYKPIQSFFGASLKSPAVALNELEIDEHQIVSSRDVPLHSIMLSYQRAPLGLKLFHAMELKKLQKMRLLGDDTMDAIIKSSVNNDLPLVSTIQNSEYKLSKKNYPCYKHLVQNFNELCFNTAKNSYMLKHMYQFVNLCTVKEVSENQVINSMKTICQPHHRATTEMN